MPHRTRILDRMPTAQAEVYRRILMDAGLDAEVVPGDLPGINVQITVPDEQVDLARAFLAEGESTGEPQTCPGCGETNPAVFVDCWSCGASLEGDGSDTQEFPAPPSPRPPLSTLLYAAVVLGLVWLALRLLF